MLSEISRVTEINVSNFLTSIGAPAFTHEYTCALTHTCARTHTAILWTRRKPIAMAHTVINPTCLGGRLRQEDCEL